MPWKNDVNIAKVAQIMIYAAAKDSTMQSEKLKAIQRGQFVVCEKQQNTRKHNDVLSEDLSKKAAY